MTAPRLTRLVRTPDLRSFQQAIALLACEGDPLSVRDRVVIVPTRGAGDILRLTIEDLWLGGWRPGPQACAACGVTEPDERRRGIVLPDLLVRDDWYAALASRLPGHRRMLRQFEREVLLRRAADQALQKGLSPPFRVRPRLLIEMLALYDALRRHRRSIEAFDRLVGDALADSADGDRGAERLLQLTRFLVATFEAYEGGRAAEAALDEHGLRELALDGPLDPAFDHVIVTVGDQVLEPEGLWAADFDLLTRLPGLRRITVVSTERVLDTGWHERLYDWLPGIEERRYPGSCADPVLLCPPGPRLGHVFVARDREEEVADFARYLHWAASEAAPPEGLALPRQAFVYQRPLPYLYLAETVLGAARLPVQSPDALPLASEPAALALDLVLSAVESGFTRGPLCALLRSPLFAFDVDGRPLEGADVDALDVRLGAAEEPLDMGTLTALGQSDGGDQASAASDGVRPAARAAAAVVRLLSPLSVPGDPGQHLARLGEFLAEYRAPPPGDAAAADRLVRAHAAIDEALAALQRAHAGWDGGDVELSDLAATLRRWIESRTFHAIADPGGVRLLDARAARYGLFERVRLAGLVETEWSVASARNVFYPALLLGPLGWPRDADRRAAARAAFDDLLTLAHVETSVSAFSLERDAIVQLSPLTEALTRDDLAWVEWLAPPYRIFDEEAMSIEPLVPAALDEVPRAWLERRRRGRAAHPSRYRGFVGARPVGEHTVTALETYLRCPFRYFSTHILRLAEEPDEESGLSPLERGRLVHEVLRIFFERWDSEEGGAITVDSADRARGLFAEVVEAALDRLPAAECGLERVRFLGSARRVGIGEQVIRHEVERAVPVEGRRLEWRLADLIPVAPDGEARRVTVGGTADRVDLLADGTLRVLDYKLGRAPRPQTALQLPIYAALSVRRLAQEGDRRRAAVEAGYLAFREPAGYVPVFSGAEERNQRVQEAMERSGAAVTGIEAGEFPPSPAEPFLCTFCPYPGVCRKDYVGDD